VSEIASRLRDKYEVIDIDGVRVKYDDGWALLRASNTQPVLVARFEALSTGRLEEIRDEMFAELKRFPYLELPA
jgi:phosphomannomutase/phosphoglucomutase